MTVAMRRRADSVAAGARGLTRIGEENKDRTLDVAEV